MTTSTEIRKLEAEVGEFVARHKRAQAVEDFGSYRDSPVGFIRAVLHRKLWRKQKEIAQSVLEHRLTAVKGCNAAGKDAVAGALALWWAVARGGLAIISGPTERQVRHVLMGREVRRLFGRNRTLPGELYELALRMPSETAGILAFAAADPDRFTGHHSPGGVLVILTESQGVEDGIIEAALACATGEGDRVLVVGNPLRPVGRFFEIFEGKNWSKITISALDHPNLKSGGEILIPGGVSREWVRTIEREYGKASPQYKSRVLGEFPAEAEELLVRRAWIDAAFEKWKTITNWIGSAVVAVDPAGQGADSTAVAVFQNGHVRDVGAWHGKDTTEVYHALLDLEAQLNIRGARFVVDGTGIGTGLVDRLREGGREVTAFIAASKARQPERYANARAEAAWCVREALESGRVAVMPDVDLIAELRTLTWSLDSRGAIMLEGKDTLRARLHRSPDRYDALAMLLWDQWPALKTRSALSSIQLEDPDNLLKGSPLTELEPVRYGGIF